MKILELAARCATAVARGEDEPVVVLTLPPGWKAPKGFPRREVLSVNERGERNCRVRADRLLAWLEREGLVRVDR